MKLQKQSEMQDFFDALGIDENIFEQWQRHSLRIL